MAANVFGLRLLARPAVQLSVLVALVAIVLAFRALQFWTLTGEIQWGYDFSAYWAAGQRTLDGLSLYQAHQLAGPYAPQEQFLYLYPPPLAALAAPLATWFGDYRAAAWVWTGLGATVLVASILAVARTERFGERFALLAGPRGWLLVAAAFALPPVVGELVMGNVHLLLLGLLAVAWLGIRRGDAAGEWAAGAAVGVAAVVKVFPGILILWFLLSRRYRATAGVVLGAVALTLVTLPVTGLEPWRDYPTVLANLSAPADVTDTLAPTVWLAPVLGFDVARWLVAASGLVMVALVAVRARRDVPATRLTSLAASFGAAVTVSVLVAPALYHHYLAILALPLLLGLVAGVPLRWLALAYLLMWGGQQDALGEWSWVVNRGLPTAGAVLLLAALAGTQARRRASSTAPATSVAATMTGQEGNSQP